MIAGVDDERTQHIIETLRSAGAAFAYLHGSRVDGESPVGSDVDIGAWWPADVPETWDVPLDDDVDLLVLNQAPLELAGRVAMYGQLLFEDDPPARVEWEATTRKIWLDERPRVALARKEALEAMAARG